MRSRMFKRLLAVLCLTMLAACGSSAGPDGGSPSTCTGTPFGIFNTTLCDGGAISPTATFYSDGGATIYWANSGTCDVDRSGCELVLTCNDSYRSVISVDWTPASERLSGVWQRNGEPNPICVVMQKQ